MTKPPEQNGHEEPDQTGDDAVDAAEPANGRVSTEEKPAETDQPQVSEPEESAPAQSSRRVPLILVAVALVLVLAAGIYMLWADHSAGSQSTQKPSSGASTAQVSHGPSGDAKAYKALQLSLIHI